MKFHKDGTLPENGEIFVFGSNLAGVHGAGAARVAHNSYGATWHRGIGLSGESYAIPTKDRSIRTLDLEAIEVYVHAFLWFAHTVPHIQFWMTGIGCGLAGYSPKVIAPMFKQAPDNISFPDTWKDWL